MKHGSLGVVALALVGLACRHAPREVAPEPGVTVTYVANEGFLLEAGDDKVLVDALFGREPLGWCPVPDAETIGRLARAEAPFDDVDLILVTHAHADHFDPALVLEHLAHDTATRLFGPPAVVAKLREQPTWNEETRERIDQIVLEPYGSATRALAGIRVEAIRVPHSAYMETDAETGETRNRHENVEHLVFVIEIGKMRILHLGDAFLDQSQQLLEADDLASRRFDIVFFEGWTEKSLAIVEQRLAPAHVVLMHLPPNPDEVRGIADAVAQRLPGAVFFSASLESRRFSPAAG